MKFYLLNLLLLLYSFKGFTRDVQKIKKNEVPEGIQIKGDFYSGFKWNDQNGINILVLSKKSRFKEDKSIYSDEAEYSELLYAEQYAIKKGEIKILWDIVDFEKHCSFDLETDFIIDAVSITDLNNNGVTETTVVYKKTCRSDVTPADMKVLMHENSNKMGLRGRMMWTTLPPFNTLDLKTFQYDLSKLTHKDKAQVASYQTSEGRFKNTLDFKEYPKTFLAHAIKTWIQFVVEQ